MSAHAGPALTEDGLVFYYDIANSQKSWKGKPTVNYITNPTEEMARGEFGQYRDLAPTFDTYGLVPYSLSMDIKVNKPGNVFVYMQNGSSSKYSFVGANVNATTEYQRFYFNNITPSIATPSDTAAILATYTGYGSGVTPTVKNIQLELGTFATPFVNGTRSATQAIVDLTGNNVITVNELTYASDGSFSFNGASNYATLSTFSNKPTTAITCETWIKPTKPSVGTSTQRGGAISSTNSMYLGIIDSTDGGSTFSMHWANQTSVNRIYNFNGSIPNSQWSYLVGTYDGITTRAYLNAVEIWSSPQTGTIPDGTYVIGTYGGALQDGVHNFNGNLPVGKIYNRALSAAEIQQNFNALRSRYGI